MSSQLGEIGFEEIGGLVMHELRRRLGSPQLAADLPGTLLMKVAADYVKHLEKRNDIEMAKLERDHEDPLIVIAQEGLPLEMRFEILSQFLDDVESAWQKASVMMEELLREVKTDDGDVLHEVPVVVPKGGELPEVRVHVEVQQDADDGEAERESVRDGGESDEGKD